MQSQWEILLEVRMKVEPGLSGSKFDDGCATGMVSIS